MLLRIQMLPATKRCSVCAENLPLDAFGTFRGRPMSRCKSCHKAKNLEWAKANPGKARAARKRWNAANPDKVREQNRRHRERQAALRPPRPPRPPKPAPHDGMCVCCNRHLHVATDFPYEPRIKPRVRSRVCYDCRTEKWCPKCDTIKPLTEFAKQRNKRDGLASGCLVCMRQATRQWAKANPGLRSAEKDRRRAANRIRHRNGVVDVAEKRCSKCHLTKPARKFHRNAATDDGLARYCKMCRNQWVAENPGRFRDYARRRQERTQAATIEAVDRFVVYDREGGRCHICGRKVARDKFHMEHLFPLSKGGDHSYANVAIAHPVCNRRKHDDVVPVQLRIG